VVVRGIFGKPMNIDELEKFTELIIKKCVSISEAGNAVAVVSVIKEHFGV
jgi:hypothetical protein